MSIIKTLYKQRKNGYKYDISIRINASYTPV